MVNEADLSWLEAVELPALSWTQATAYQAVQWDAGRTPNALFDRIDEIRSRCASIDRLDWACGDTTLPIEQRERIARAFFRVAAWEALASNELNESQKAWAVTQLKKKSQQADRILAVWMTSQDPHAMLVRALRDTMPKATAIEIGRVVEHICDGWGFAVPDRLSKAEMKTLVKRFAELAKTAGVVEAVLQWLPVVPDFERRVLHAGALLASEGSRRSAGALGQVLAGAADREWAVTIWSQLAPNGSAVRAL